MEMKSVEMAEDLAGFLEMAGPVFDLLPDPIRVADMEGNIKYVNRAFLQLTGYSPTEVLEQKLFESYVEEDKARIQTVFHAVLKTGRQDQAVEARMKRKGGNPVMVSLKAVLLKNSRNEPIGGFALFRDVSRMERIMAEPMEILNLSGSPVEVLRQLPARVASYFPARPWVMINLIEGEYLQFAYAVNVPPELMAQGGEPLEGSICSIPIKTAQFLGIGDMTADERTRQDPCVTQYGCRGYLGYPIFHSSGKIMGTICVLRSQRGGFGEYDQRILQMFATRAAMEIERMELETRVEQSEKELLDFVAHAPLLVWRILPDGRILTISKKGKKDLGYKEEESIKASWFELVHPDDLPEIRRQIAAVSSAKGENGMFSAAVRFRKRDGEYGNFFTTVRPVYDMAGRLKLLEGVTLELPSEETSG